MWEEIWFSYPLLVLTDVNCHLCYFFPPTGKHAHQQNLVRIYCIIFWGEKEKRWQKILQSLATVKMCLAGSFIWRKNIISSKRWFITMTSQHQAQQEPLNTHTKMRMRGRTQKRIKPLHFWYLQKLQSSFTPHIKVAFSPGSQSNTGTLSTNLRGFLLKGTYISVCFLLS